MYQQFTAVGNLGNDPEMRYLDSGVPVTSFSLAINKSWTGQDGQRKDKTLWVRVTCWRKLAEVVSQYCRKGQQVLITGELEEARAFTDRDGNNRASLEITAQTVKFLGSKGDAQAGSAAPTPTAQQQAPAVGAIDAEEITF